MENVEQPSTNRTSQFQSDFSDSGIDLNSDEENKNGDKTDPNENLDPSSMRNVQPSPKKCITSKATASSDVTRENLYSSAQQVIEDLNAKRKQDTELLADFKKTLEEQVVRSCSRVEQHVFASYEKKGDVIQKKLQELYGGLDRIQKIEVELQQFKNALGGLYQDMSHD